MLCFENSKFILTIIQSGAEGCDGGWVIAGFQFAIDYGLTYERKLAYEAKVELF